MKCKNLFKCYLSIFVAFSLTPQPKAFAQANSSGCQAELYKPSSIPQTDTPKLTAVDIIGDNNVEQVGNQDQPLSTTPPYKLSTTKNIPRYWQMRVNNLDFPINLSDVKYRFISSTEPNNPFKQNKFEPKPFGTIERIENCIDQTTVISGGVTFDFKELSSLVPGKFRGEIEVCIQIKDKPQCQ